MGVLIIIQYYFNIKVHSGFNINWVNEIIKLYIIKLYIYNIRIAYRNGEATTSLWSIQLHYWHVSHSLHWW